jgi:Tol biopolymer transport system component
MRRLLLLLALMFAVVLPARAWAAVTVSAAQPAVADVNGGTVVRLSGSGFTKPLTVTIDGVLAPIVSSPSTSQALVVAPAHLAGPATIVVTNAAGETITRGDLLSYSIFGSIGAATPIARASLSADGLPAGVAGQNFVGSVGGAMSGDGSKVVFVSDADLPPYSAAASPSLYQKNLVDGSLVRVAQCDCTSVSMSLDGRRIAARRNPGGILEYYDAPFSTGPVRIDVALDGGAPNGTSGAVMLSGTGRYVAFASTATNLDDTTGDIPNTPDLFLRDLVEQRTVRLTQAKGISFLDISAEGDRIVLLTTSPLVPEDTNGLADVYALSWTLGHESLRLITPSANGASQTPRIAADGRTIVFVSIASNLVAGDTNGLPDLFAADWETGALTRLLPAMGGTSGNAGPGPISLSGDARFVAFGTPADNIVPGDQPGTIDLFVFDRVSGTTVLIGASSSGIAANNAANNGSLSIDGHRIAFPSMASNLVPDDTNNFADVFVKALPPDTPAGANVNVRPVEPGSAISPITLTFDAVLTAGDTSFVLLPPVALPAPWSLAGEAYFSLATTAVFTGNVTICGDYSDLEAPDASSLRLIHYDGGSWHDVTISNDTGAQVLCGRVSSLSPFAVAINTDHAAPVMSAPSNVSVDTSNPAGTTVAFTPPTAVDDVDGVVPVTCTPAPGAAFGVGVTQVVCQAVDRSGNQATTAFTVTVTYVAPPSASPLARFVALGRTQVWLKNGATVKSGDIAASEAARESRGHRHGGGRDDEDRDLDRAVEVRIGSGVTIEQASSHVAGDTIWIGPRAVVFDVMGNEIDNHRGLILGTRTSPASLPVVAWPVAASLPPVSGPAVTVAKKATRTLAPGAYGRVRVGAKGTMILSAGAYTFESLDVDDNATVLFRGAVHIRIRRELDTDHHSRLIADAAAGVAASDVLIEVLGGDAACEHRGLADDDEPGPTVVHIGQDNDVTATILAPNGTLWVRAKSKVTGALIAEQVRVGARVTLVHDSAIR